MEWTSILRLLKSRSFSMLLKCLEGESAQSINDLLLFHERALPDLGDNIRGGNSLISTDMYSTDIWKGLSEQERTAPSPLQLAGGVPRDHEIGRIRRGDRQSTLHRFRVDDHMASKRSRLHVETL